MAYNRFTDYCGVGGYYDLLTAAEYRRYAYGTWLEETPTVSDLKVTKERVVAAAAKCGDAARVLKELFPEAFVKPHVASGELQIDGISRAEVREYGEYEGIGFYLDDYRYDWAIVKDNEGTLVLVPTRRA
jgi:hypothetical protein